MDEEQDKRVALIEVTPDLLKQQRMAELMDLAQRIVRDQSMRWKIEDLPQAVDLIEQLVIPLNRVYDKLESAIDGGVEDVLHIPNLSEMSLEQLLDLKAQMNKGTSVLDKQITVVRNRKS